MTADKKQGPATADPQVDELARDANRAAKIVGEDLKTAGDEVRRDAERAAQAIGDEAAVAGKQAEGMANEQKNAMAAHLESIAGAIRRAADELEGESSPGARATREAAERVGQISEALKDNSIGDLVGLAEDFGRQQPVAFLGASALAGFAASRFIVASGNRTRRSPAGQDRPNPSPDRSVSAQTSGSREQAGSPQQGGSL